MCPLHAKIACPSVCYPRASASGSSSAPSSDTYVPYRTTGLTLNPTTTSYLTTRLRTHRPPEQSHRPSTSRKPPTHTNTLIPILSRILLEPPLPSPPVHIPRIHLHLTSSRHNTTLINHLHHSPSRRHRPHPTPSNHQHDTKPQL